MTGGSLEPSMPDRASLDDLDRAPVSLPDTQPVDYKSQLETLRARFSEVTADKDRLQQDFEDLRRGSSTIAELDKLIAPSANKAFRYMSAYSAGSFALLVLDGSQWRGFNLDEGVLELLVGSTAVTVLGLVGMVLTGIFVGARRAINKIN
jgi:hypothetical protein